MAPLILLLSCSPADGSGEKQSQTAATGSTTESGAAAGTTDSRGGGPTDDSAYSDSPGQHSDTQVTQADDTGATAGELCTAWAPAVGMGTVADASLDELSGLVVSQLNPGILWTHEDSGGAAALYALDTTGALVATLSLEGADNVDWEALALSTCDAGWCFTVGDIGDVGTDRDNFVLYRVPEPILDGAAELVALAESQGFSYPSDAEDAEALVVTPEGDAVIFSKREDATSNIYRLVPGDSVLEPLGSLSTGTTGETLTAMVTAADLWPLEGRLLLRTYLHLYQLEAYDFSDLGDPVAVPFAFELQGEAIAWDPLVPGFWQVAEGVGPTLWFTACEG